MGKAEDIIRETFSGVAKAIGVRIDISDEMITDLAATLQTEIDRLEAVETESFEFLNELALAFRRGEKHARPQHTPILEGIRAVLAHLASAGRLLAADEMRLTAELAGDLRMVLDSFGFNQVTPEVVQAIEASKRLTLALFPATEPAEDVMPIGWYRAMTRKFATAHFGFPEVTGLLERTHTASDGGVWGYCGGEWELREYPPAPAEPAEEETKAEVGGDFIEIVLTGPPAAVSGRFVEVENPQGASISVGEWIDRGDGFWALRIPYASSPVVPAPTEASVIGGAAVALRAALELVDPHEAGPWEHAWLTAKDLEDCAGRAEAIAPTETEWQTWQEVPEGVKYSPKARPPAGSPLRLLAQPLWVNRGGTRYQARSGTVSKIGNVEMFHYAPFVAAEEG